MRHKVQKLIEGLFLLKDSLKEKLISSLPAFSDEKLVKMHAVFSAFKQKETAFVAGLLQRNKTMQWQANRLLSQLKKKGDVVAAVQEYLKQIKNN